jgi:hypothetical protein
MAATYFVDGVSRNVEDILAESVSIDFLFNAYFDPDEITARGFACHRLNADTNAPIAAGALLPKLRSPFTFVLEWEDIEWSPGLFMRFTDADDDYEGGEWVSGDRPSLDFRMPDFEPLTVSGGSEYAEAFRFAGVNKIAATIGNDVTTISLNGIAAPSPVDTTGFWGPWIDPPGGQPDRVVDRIYPFGRLTQINGFVRRLTILPPQPANLLDELSALDTPGFITDLAVASVTATSVTLSFTAAEGATSHEYWIQADGDGFGWPDPENADWYPLDVSKVISDLTTETRYAIFVRGVNAFGPGPATADPVTPTTS